MEKEIIIDCFNGIDLDFVVLGQNYSKVQTQTPGAKTIVLDHMLITESLFKSVFYSSETGIFGLIPENKVIGKLSNILPTPLQTYKEIISLESPLRSVNGTNFNLLECIFTNIEECLGVGREAFTMESTIALNKEFSNIRTLYDLDINAVINALTWDELIDSVRNKTRRSYSTKTRIEHVRLHLGIIFKTPTYSVLPLTVKLVYDLNLTIPASDYTK